MVDLVITATSTVAGDDAVKEAGIAGETITAGQVVYKDASTKKWKLCDADSATAAVRQPYGIALNGGASGQPVTVQTAGSLTLGATLTAGTAYYLSATPGGICPVADVGASEYVTLIGLSTSTTVLKIVFQYTGVAL